MRPAAYVVGGWLFHCSPNSEYGAELHHLAVGFSSLRPSIVGATATVIAVTLKSLDFDRQVAELQVRAAVLNRFTQLGTPETVRVG